MMLRSLSRDVCQDVAGLLVGSEKQHDLNGGCEGVLGGDDLADLMIPRDHRAVAAFPVRRLSSRKDVLGHVMTTATSPCSQKSGTSCPGNAPEIDIRAEVSKA